MDLSEYIVRFGTESAKESEISSHAVVEARTEDNITIDQRHLGDFFDETFRIPDYQRNYQWGKKEWQELWRRIDEYLDYDRTDPSTRTTDVFFGSMFLSERSAGAASAQNIEGGFFDVIDGQQRVTTVSIIFKILSTILAQEMSNCSQNFITQYSQHVGLLNNQIFQRGGPESDPSLVRADSGIDSEDLASNSFYAALMGSKSDRIQHLLQREEQHNNTRIGVIEIGRYIDIFDIEMNEYLSALLDDSNFEGAQRPNIPDSKMNEVRRSDEPADFDDNFRQYIKENKISFKSSEQNLLDAYVFFSDEISNKLKYIEEKQDLDSERQSEEKYRLATNIKNFILDCFIVGYYKVNDSQPQLLMRIFEVLNEHGVELNRTDLIRTRLVMHFRGDEEYEEYKSKWDNVIEKFGGNSTKVVNFLETYFVATENGITSRGQVSNHLLEPFTKTETEEDELDSRVSTIGDAKGFVDELVEYSKYYKHIDDPLNEGFKLNNEDLQRQCNRILTRLVEADTSIWKSLILAAYADVQQNQASATGLKSLLLTVESLVIRFAVGGSVNAKDATYAKGIDAYDAHGVSPQVEEILVDTAYQRANEIFGERLISELARNDWSNNKARSVLRKIASENLNPEEREQMLHRRLYSDNTKIQVEHVFPTNPININFENPYSWIIEFFELNKVTLPSSSDDNISIEQILKYLVKNEEDSEIEEICSKYSDLLGNRVLLLGSTNQEVGNSRYSRKLAGYSVTDGFSELVTSEEINSDLEDDNSVYLKKYGQYREHMNMGTDFDTLDLVDSDEDSVDEETIREEIQDLEPIIKEYNGRWTINRVKNNSANLLRELAELIDFSNCTSNNVNFESSLYDTDEFEDIGYTNIVEQELEDLRGLIEYNHRRSVRI